jgi:hypothetical protein
MQVTYQIAQDSKYRSPRIGLSALITFVGFCVVWVMNYLTRAYSWKKKLKAQTGQAADGVADRSSEAGKEGQQKPGVASER